MIQLLTLIMVSYELMKICTSCIRLLTYLYFIIAINTGLEIERVCRPRENESPGSYYERAQAYYLKIGNWEEWRRVIRLNSYMKQTETDGWIVPRTAEYYRDRVRRKRDFAMSFSCKRSFAKLRAAIEFHDTAMEPEEVEKYKLLEGGWTSDADWDDELKDREAEVNSGKWVGGLPSPIKNNLKEIRERQEEEWKPPAIRQNRKLEYIGDSLFDENLFNKLMY